MDAKTKNDSASTADREMVITRIVDAPRELVWEAMTNPKHVVNWWGPNGFTNTLEKMDFRVGGVWKHVMHGPDGNDYPNFSTFTAIVKPERIEFLHGGTSKGDPAVQFDATWTFEALGNQTRVTIRAVFPTVEACDITVKVYNAIEGGKQTLARLADYLLTMSAGKDGMAAGKADLVLTRIFDAPRELVWEALTNPEHLMRWWAPKGCTTPFCKVDLRIGGKFLYCMRLPEGRDIWGMGIYREIVAPSLLVYTDSFADAQGDPVPPEHYGMSAGHPTETLVTMSFEEHEGKTRLTLRHGIPESVEERKGTEQGWSEMLDRLAEDLAKA